MCPSTDIGTSSVLWRIPLASARIQKFSRSRVMPRSWPTTIPGVMISTEHPRSARSSATEVAWWNPTSSSTTTSPSGATSPARTSRTSHIHSAPSGAHQGLWGTDPVATTTESGDRRATSAASTRTPYSISTPRRPASWSWLRTRSPNSARLGTLAASATCPPAAPAASHTVTRWPLRAAAMAACRPAGPAPTTSTSRVRRTSTGSPVLPCSLPVRGFSMHPSHRLRPMRPTHSWLQLRHNLVSSA